MAFFNNLKNNKFKSNSKSFDKDSRPKNRKSKEQSSAKVYSKIKSVKNKFNTERGFVPNEKVPKYLKYEYEDKKKDIVSTNIQEEMDENILVGRNPIREALKAGRDIEKIMVLKGELSGSANELIAKAKEKKIVVQEVDRKKLDSIATHNQGMIAIASAYKYYDVDDILNYAKDKGEDPFIVMLDGITDPHNLGAIIRSAECAGAHGIIIQARRAVGLTSAAVKASAGAIEHIKVAKVTNLNGMVDSLKRKGLWVYATDMDGENYKKVDYSGPVLLIIGSEGDGVSQILLNNADKKISIPMKGNIESLNASVAAGIVLFEISTNR